MNTKPPVTGAADVFAGAALGVPSTFPPKEKPLAGGFGGPGSSGFEAAGFGAEKLAKGFTVLPEATGAGTAKLLPMLAAVDILAAARIFVRSEVYFDATTPKASLKSTNASLSRASWKTLTTDTLRPRRRA